MTTTSRRLHPQPPPGWKRRVRAALRDDRGGTALEMAVIAPPILLLLFVALQICLLSYARSTAHTAAREAANAERAYNAPAGAGEAKANDFLARNASDWLTGTTVTVTRTATDVTVVVSGQGLSILPGVSFGVTRTAHGAVERFTTPGTP
ncbi:MAG: hypothetical protein V7603_5088 [Micromonosporaceae bacterium]